MKAIRSAVIGTGFIGAVHAEAVRRVGAQLVGVLGSSPERGKAGAERIGTGAFETMDDLLASDVDVIHVASPNSLHAEHSIAALEAGKHVVCEKPLAINVADAKRMVRAATDSHLVHATCFNIRFYPLLHEARQRIASGAIGPVHQVTGSYLQDWLLKPTDWNWRLDEAIGGHTRAIADIGSHWLDLAQFVVGAPVTRVFADLQTVHRTRKRPVGEVETFQHTGGASIDVPISNDDAGTVLLRFGSGAHGALTVSQVAAGRKNDLQLNVDGASNAMAWSSTDPDVLFTGSRDGGNTVTRRDPGAMDAHAARISFYPGGHVEGFGETFRGLVQQVYADVAAGSASAEGQTTYPTFHDGLRAVAIDDAIHRSAETGGWIDIERATP